MFNFILLEKEKEKEENIFICLVKIVEVLYGWLNQTEVAAQDLGQSLH